MAKRNSAAATAKKLPLTCVVETVQDGGFPEVQFPKMQGLQGGAHHLTRLPQALQGLALGHHQLPLACLVDHIRHGGPPAAPAARVAPASGGAAPGGGSWAPGPRSGRALHVPETARRWWWLWRQRQLARLALRRRRRSSSPPAAAALRDGAKARGRKGWHGESDALAGFGAHLCLPGCRASDPGVPSPDAPSG